jgi:hypothetical protein
LKVEVKSKKIISIGSTVTTPKIENENETYGKIKNGLIITMLLPS